MVGMLFVGIWLDDFVFWMSFFWSLLVVVFDVGVDMVLLWCVGFVVVWLEVVDWLVFINVLSVLVLVCYCDMVYC